MLRKDPHTGMQLDSITNKAILSYIRNGRYQHPGEEEAIDLIFKGIKKDSRQRLLDIGCGLGGTAHYLNEHGWGAVTGIDINHEVLANAKEHYSQQRELHFYEGDVLALDAVLAGQSQFDVIYCLNSFFLFPDQITALEQIKRFAHNETRLIIFDYVDLGNYYNAPYVENGKLFLPNLPKLSEISDMLDKAKWRLQSVEDVSGHYIDWYNSLLERLKQFESKIIEQYGAEAYQVVYRRYEHIYESCLQKIIGGAIIYAAPLG